METIPEDTVFTKNQQTYVMSVSTGQIHGLRNKWVEVGSGAAYHHSLLHAGDFVLPVLSALSSSDVEILVPQRGTLLARGHITLLCSQFDAQ